MPALNPWALLGALLLAIALAGGGYYEGWEKRGDHEAALALKAKEAADKALEQERVRGDQLATDLEHEKQNIKTVTVEVVKEIPKVTTVYVEAPGEAPKPIPPGIYTNGFVRLWNSALFPTGGVRSAAGESLDLSGGADTVRAKIDSPDILANAGDNFGKYAECRTQLRKLIDFEKGRPPPAQ